MRKIFKLPLLASLGLAVALGTIGAPGAGLMKGSSAVYASGFANITPETFFAYFDEKGVLYDTPGSNFCFAGDFSDIGVSEIVLPYDGMCFFGNEATFTDTTFVIAGNDITLSKLTIYDESPDCEAAIEVSGSGAYISDNDITYINVDGDAGYAVHFTNTDDNQLYNNEINYEGFDGLVENIAIKCDSETVTDDTGITMYKNTITADMPACDVNYDSGYENPGQRAAAIDIRDTNFIYMAENEIEVNVSGTEGDFPSVVGAYLTTEWDPYETDTKNGSVQVVSNSISVKCAELEEDSTNYSAYGVINGAELYSYSQNTIDVESNYWAEAIDIQSPAMEGAIEGNTINVNAVYAHGIYAFSWLTGFGELSVIENEVTTNGTLGCGMYASLGNHEDEPDWITTVKGNTFSGEGNYINGIYLVSCSNSDISENTINALGSNEIPSDDFDFFNVYKYIYEIEGQSEPLEQYLGYGIYVNDNNASISNNIIMSSGLGIIAACTTDITENIVNDEEMALSYYAINLEEGTGENKSSVHDNLLYGWNDAGYRVTGDDAVKACEGTDVFGNLPCNITDKATVTIPNNALNYKNRPVKPKPTVTLGDKILVEGEDYFINYLNEDGAVVADPIDAGNYYVAVCGKGNYNGEIDTPYTIKKVKISSVTLKKASLPYNGSRRTQTPTVQTKVDGTLVTLTQGTKTGDTGDYYLTFSNNLNVGTATVTVTGKGNFTGSVKKTFKILPKGSSIVSLTPESKAVTVKWKKQAAKMSKGYITGYQIQFATDKNFTKNKKTFTVKGYSITGKKASGLLAGKTYYVRIRTYKTVSGTNYYSDWATVKTVKTK